MTFLSYETGSQVKEDVESFGYLPDAAIWGMRAVRRLVKSFSTRRPVSITSS